jgi:hypothetical protein
MLTAELAELANPSGDRILSAKNGGKEPHGATEPAATPELSFLFVRCDVTTLS